MQLQNAYLNCDHESPRLMLETENGFINEVAALRLHLIPADPKFIKAASELKALLMMELI